MTLAGSRDQVAGEGDRLDQRAALARIKALGLAAAADDRQRRLRARRRGLAGSTYL
jgi:hypothetical protein